MPVGFRLLATRTDRRFAPIQCLSHVLPYLELAGLVGPLQKLGENAADRSGNIFVLRLLGLLQKAPQFLFGGHVCMVFFPARHGETIAGSCGVGKGAKLP